LLASLLVLPSVYALSETKKGLILGALLLAILVMVRPTGFFLILWMLPAFVLWGVSPLRFRVARAFLFLVVWIIPFIPWVVRNQTTFGEPVFFTTHGGITFYQGNNEKVRDIPRYFGGVAPLHALPGYEEIEKIDEVEKNRQAWKMGRTFVKENWRDMPVMTARKFFRFWRFKSDVGLSGVKSGWWWNKDRLLGRMASSLDVGLIYAVVVFPLFLVGLIALLRNFRELCFLYGVIAAHTLVALVFFGSLRGRIPIEPVIAMFATAGLLKIIDRFRPSPLEDS
jgi:energy-coupling factor transporter transmembrane protein EcfT